MAIDMFATRTMLPMMEQMLPVRTFLRETFFSRPETFDTEKVDIDIRKGSRRMAPFVNPRIGSKTVDGAGFATDTWKPPMVAPNTVTDAQSLLNRAPGEHVYGGLTPTERAARKLGEDVAELDDMITRREEWMCRQALFGGKVVCVGEDFEAEIDFHQELNDEVTDAEKFNGTGNPDDVLIAMRDKIIEKTGLTPDILIMGSTAIKSYLANKNIKESFDTRRIDNGTFDPKTLPNGVIYYGRLKNVGVDVYTYLEWYLDDETGESTPMIPADYVLMGCSTARTYMAYGAIVFFDDNNNAETFEAARVPRSWVEKNPSVRFVEVNSRPLPVPQQIDAFYVKKVVI